MISVVTNDRSYEFRGLSTDDKPIGTNCSNYNVNYPVGNGSIFFEMDTSKVFMLKVEKDGEEYKGTWLEI